MKVCRYVKAINTSILPPVINISHLIFYVHTTDHEIARLLPEAKKVVYSNFLVYEFWTNSGFTNLGHSEHILKIFLRFG